MCLFIKMSSSSSSCTEVARIFQSSLWEWGEGKWGGEGGGDDKGEKLLLERFRYLSSTRGKSFYGVPALQLARRFKPLLVLTLQWEMTCRYFMVQSGVGVTLIPVIQLSAWPLLSPMSLSLFLTQLSFWGSLAVCFPGFGEVVHTWLPSTGTGL